MPAHGTRTRAAASRAVPGREPRTDDYADIRKFVLRLAMAACIWGAFFFWGNWKAYGFWLEGCGAALLAGLVHPPLFRNLRLLLIALGSAIGRALAFLALAVIYFAGIVPLGLLARMSDKRFLAKGKDPAADSYWEARDPAPAGKADLERQF
jgi:hypothetical protein